MQCLGTLDGFLTGWLNIWNLQEHLDFEVKFESSNLSIAFLSKFTIPHIPHINIIFQLYMF